MEVVNETNLPVWSASVRADTARRSLKFDLRLFVMLASICSRIGWGYGGVFTLVHSQLRRRGVLSNVDGGGGGDTGSERDHWELYQNYLILIRKIKKYFYWT